MGRLNVDVQPCFGLMLDGKYKILYVCTIHVTSFAEQAQMCCKATILEVDLSGEIPRAFNLGVLRVRVFDVR